MKTPHNILSAVEAELREALPPAPGAPAPEPGLADQDSTSGMGASDLPTDDLTGELPEPASSSPKSEARGRYGALKELARKDLPTLKHLLAIKKILQEKGDMSGKDCSLSLQSVLTRLFRYSENDALQFGRIQWEPDLVAWTGFFDDMGDMKLGEYLGISSMAEVPKGPASEADGSDTSNLDTTGELPSDEMSMGTDPEVPGLDAPANGEAAPRVPPPRPGAPRESVASVRWSGERVHLMAGSGRRLETFRKGTPEIIFEQVARACRRRRMSCPQLDYAQRRVLALPSK